MDLTGFAFPFGFDNIGRVKTLSGDANLNNKEKVSIQADAGLRWSYVVEVMDACKKAGFTNIGFAPPADAGEEK